MYSQTEGNTHGPKVTSLLSDTSNNRIHTKKVYALKGHIWRVLHEKKVHTEETINKSVHTLKTHVTYRASSNIHHQRQRLERRHDEN